MKVDDKSPKKPLIFYYLIAMVVLMLLTALVSVSYTHLMMSSALASV